jgi:site-specific DNA-methyltransferase (adenine-specific)
MSRARPPDRAAGKEVSVKSYYESGGVVLYHGDYQDVLPSLKSGSIDLLLSDPPYNITALEWDMPVNWPLFWEEAHRVCTMKAAMVLFASGKFTNDLINSNRKYYRYELIWEKTMPTGFLSAKRRPLRSHENVLVFIRRYKQSIYHPQMTVGKVHQRGSSGSAAKHYSTVRRAPSGKSNLFYPRSVIRFPNARGARSLHPTQKNLELMEWLVRTYSNRGQVVLDCFAGSGTTLVAALRNGRRAIGLDSSEKFCEITAERLRREVADEQ